MNSEFWNAIQAASNQAAGIVSGPVDIASWLLRKAGAPVPENALLSSKWMEEQGLMKSVKPGVGQMVGDTIGLLAPIAAAAKAPQIAAAAIKGGENLAAPRTLGTQRGIFMGDLSKTWDKAAADKARQMEKAGVDARKIWEDTGTFKGVDGKWRQEIDDSAAVLDHPMPNIVELRNKSRNAKTLDEAKRLGEEYNQWMDTVRGSPAVTSMSVTRREDISGLRHPELLNAYPEGQPRIWWENIGSPKGGSFDVEKNKVSIGLGSYADPAESKSIAMHELQHAIQERQGFAAGGSPGSGERAPFIYGGKADQRRKEIERLFDLVPYDGPEYKKLVDEFRSLEKRSEAEAAFEGYRRLAGEAEARAVQARMNLTAEQRRALFPLDSYDVPVDQLIVRQGSGPQMSILERNGQGLLNDPPKLGMLR